MNKTRIQKMVTHALKLKDPKITDIHRTPGGLTNRSYFVTVNGEKFVIRIPGHGTEALINRKEEKDNLLYATALGINPELIYFNIDSGFKITRKINGAFSVTPAFARSGNTMKQIIHIFKHLHGSEIPMKNHFKL